jgi:hypothetical protein
MKLQIGLYLMFALFLMSATFTVAHDSKGGDKAPKGGDKVPKGKGSSSSSKGKGKGSSSSKGKGKGSGSSSKGKGKGSSSSSKGKGSSSSSSKGKGKGSASSSKGKGKGKGSSSSGKGKGKGSSSSDKRVEPTCKFFKYFTEAFDTDKLVESNYPPYADISVWEGNRLCKGKDNDKCEFKPARRALTGYTEPDYAIGKAYGKCITLGHGYSTLCTDQFFFDDESKSTLEIQGVTFNTTDPQETIVLGGTGCFKNAQGTVTIATVIDDYGNPLYTNFDIYHVVVPEDNGVVLLD